MERVLKSVSLLSDMAKRHARNGSISVKTDFDPKRHVCWFNPPMERRSLDVSKLDSDTLAKILAAMDEVNECDF